MEQGFRVELVAREPLVEAPVALSFDDRGRIWVVEMRGYMRDLAGTGEDQPSGRISILEDRDGDGRMDARKTFLDSLVLPRALAPAYGGLLFAEPPNLWWVPIHDDRPGPRQLVDSTYALGGNVEHQPNGLLRHLDNWYYNAKSTRRYRRVGGRWLIESTPFRGQWGITQDDWGHLLYNDNSNQLLGDWCLPNELSLNPHFEPLEGLNEVIVPDQRVYPLHPTPVNRGYQEGVLDAEGRLLRFTSACGPLVYRGDQFPRRFRGQAFVCAPEA
ncbi:MAG: dehydrogenase, partial [Bacteroidetes bacterium]